jgi:hypothetical protein
MSGFSDLEMRNIVRSATEPLGRELKRLSCKLDTLNNSVAEACGCDGATVTVYQYGIDLNTGEYLGWFINTFTGTRSEIEPTWVACDGSCV